MIRILLADDHPLIRMGLHTTIEQEQDLIVIGEATNGIDALSFCQELSPDILLLDLSMPGPSPITNVRNLLEHCPKTKIIMLTAFDDEIYVRNLVNLGVSGYILKDEAPETLIRAIRAASEGDIWFSHRVVDILAKPTAPPFQVSSKNNSHLTDRETEVLIMMAKGCVNSDIALSLAIAEGTVKNHIVNIYQKLGVRSRAEAVAWVWQHEESR